MGSEERAQKALDYFYRGYSCAQAVFAAFHEDMGLGESEALRLASSLGGGVGGLREVCGAFCSLSLALGALKGYDMPDDMERKKAHYALIQAQGTRFSDAFGTLICRELLERQGIQPSPVPAERNAEYYRARPCARYVEACARWGQEALQGTSAEGNA